MAAAVTAVELSRVEADRLVIALDQHVEAEELPVARHIVAHVRHGRLPVSDDVAALVRRCLSVEGTAPAVLDRLPGAA